LKTDVSQRRTAIFRSVVPESVIERRHHRCRLQVQDQRLSTRRTEV